MKRFICLLVMAMFLLPLAVEAENVELLEIADVLKEVESNNNVEAVGDGGLALGALQIHKACIQDVNRYYGTTYTHKDAKKPKIANDIFIKYLSLGIKLYKIRCGTTPTEYQIVRMWNGGIYRGYEYKSTLGYLSKYIKQKENYLGSA